MREDIASSQQSVAVLNAKTKSRGSQKIATLSAVTDDALLREAGTEEFCQILKASMAVQTYAAGDFCVP